MRRLLLMSILLIQLVLPMWWSAKANPQRMLKRTLWIIVVYYFLWALIAPQLYLRYLTD